MAQIPIVFIGGMSGSGKTTLAEWVESDMGFLHLNIDLEGSDGIDVNGLRLEWDTFMREGDARPLADVLRRKVQNARAAGAVLSFPSTAVFHRVLVDGASRAGIVTVILHARREQCLKQFLAREQRTGRRLTVDHWRHNNIRLAELYAGEEYQGERLAVFTKSGERRPRGRLVRAIQARIEAAGLR